MGKLELMSPAGSLEGIYAAARSGADAIYFGGGKFNARRNAKNLSEEELETAIKYLRLRGKKSYITVNTLATDRELKELLPFLQFLNNVGASAVIVQDLAVAKILQTAFPDMPIHASTQMTVHNLAGALAAAKLGFSRVVLSRELPASEIQFITENCGIETEIFCHGALCMSYSGQCYMSAAIGGRSGNRGLCAQPCRMQYSFPGEKSGAHLSLKDLCLAPYLNQIADLGVSCVKIEGRMKRPEYTAYVTQVYRKAIDSGLPPSKEEMDNLALLFSRDGFTDGYFSDKKGPHMFGMREETQPKELKALYKEAQQLYIGEEAGTVPITMHFEAQAGRPMLLACITGDGEKYSCEGVVPEKANFKPTSAADVQANLEKTGGTVFYAQEMEVFVDDGLKIPLSAVNAMRRQGLEALAAQRKVPPARRNLEWNEGFSRGNVAEKPQTIYSFLYKWQITPEILALKPAYVYLPLDEIVANSAFCKELCKSGVKLGAVLNRIIFDREWVAVVEKLDKARKIGACAIVCTNLGHVTLLADVGMELRGDFGLNIYNSQAMKQYKALGLQCQTLSVELNFPQIRDISKCCDTELIVYGRLPLMITESCAIKNHRGNACNCKQGEHSIQDKTGRSFPLVSAEGCRNTVYNSEPIFLADKQSSFDNIGLTYIRLNFTLEGAAECLKIAKSYDGSTGYTPEVFTRGMYSRGVE